MAEFARPSAIAFYAGVLGMSADHEDLMAVAALIVAKGLVEVKARDAQSSGQQFRHVDAESFRRLCEKLEAFGWLTQAEPGAKSRTPRWLVNPLVHQLFAKQGKLENERRERARQAIQATLAGRGS